MSALGWVHMFFGIAAVIAGMFVVLRRKGTRRHRTMGYLYVTCMVALNLTGLSIYRLTGSFNFFHASALVSLAFLLIGITAVLRRRPKGGWLRLHAHFLSGSYVGVIAALFAEVAARVPGWNFGLAVGITTLVVTGVGVYWIATKTEGAIENIPTQINP